MKTYSFARLVAVVIAFSLQLGCSQQDVTSNPEPSLGQGRKGAATALPQTNLQGSCNCGQYLSGRHIESGFFVYPNQTVDLSGCEDGTVFLVSFTPEDVPNRFALLGDGGGTAAESGQQSNTSGHNGWIGTTSNPGPWGMSGFSTGGSETTTFVKMGSGIYNLRVETVVQGTTDSWSVTIQCYGPANGTTPPSAPGCAPFSIYVPNVFTPNGDGINDTFVIKDASNSTGPLNATSLNLVVVNRWGAKVYEGTVSSGSGLNGGVSVWNGNTSSGTPLPSGLYYYYLVATNACQGSQPYKGYVQILRES